VGHGGDELGLLPVEVDLVAQRLLHLGVEAGVADGEGGGAGEGGQDLGEATLPRVTAVRAHDGEDDARTRLGVGWGEDEVALAVQGPAQRQRHLVVRQLDGGLAAHGEERLDGIGREDLGTAVVDDHPRPPVLLDLCAADGLGAREQLPGLVGQHRDGLLHPGQLGGARRRLVEPLEPQPLARGVGDALGLEHDERHHGSEQQRREG
jgi:hypothetical protein